LTLALQHMGQNRRAEDANDASCLLAEFFLEDRGAWPRRTGRSRAEAGTHGVLSGTASRPLTNLMPRAAVPGERRVSRAHDVPKICGTWRLCCRCAARTLTENLASRRRLTERTERSRSSASPHNGSDAKLHGQGPRAEARAARGALHVRRANARRVTPRNCDSHEPARPAGRSRAVPASAAS